MNSASPAKGIALALALSTSLIAGNAIADVVGRTTHAADVDPIGRAEVSIPIWVPPGIAGLQPRLSIAYTTSGMDDIVGVGTSLQGLSSISRCPRTIAQDGAVAGIVANTTDKFCLNGNKLRLLTGVYGQDASTYETELQTFSRVSAYTSGASGWLPSSGPQWFQLKDGEGKTYQFGATDDSRLAFSGATVARTWALNRITDTSGNYISFSYLQDNGALRPSLITYTGTAGGDGPYRVVFGYEVKPTEDQRKTYVAGSLVQQRYRLTSIDVQYNFVSTRNYAFTYKPTSDVVTRRSLLQSVTECAGTDCRPPTQISWRSVAQGFGSPLSTFPASASGSRLMDVDGDGRDDLVTTSGGQLKLRLGQSNGSLGSTKSVNYPDTYFTASLVLDYNGDGRGDLLIPNSSGINWDILTYSAADGTLVGASTSTPISYALTDITTADINGDGLDDLIWTQPDQRVMGRLNTGGAFEATPRELYNAGYGFGSIPFGSYPNVYRSVLRKGDFNGDGVRRPLAPRVNGRVGERGICELTKQSKSVRDRIDEIGCLPGMNLSLPIVVGIEE